MFGYNKINHFECDNLSLSQIMARWSLWDQDLEFWCGVSRRTVQRWIKDNNPPPMAKRLIWLIASGLPPFAGWQHMRIDKDGYLHTETGQKLTSGQINAVFWHESRIRWLQDALNEKAAQVAAMTKELERRHFLFTPANELMDVEPEAVRQLTLL